jgi:hypothetical protein
MWSGIADTPYLRGGPKMGKETMIQELSEMSVKTLLQEAKEYHVVGRHEMCKKELVYHIVAKMEEKLANEQDMALERNGMTLDHEALEAFREAEALEEVLVKGTKVEEHWEGSGPVVLPLESPMSCKSKYIEQAVPGTIVAFRVDEYKVLSGIIEEVHALEFVIRTKNGVKFTVRKRNVIWVRTGPRWPRGVYLALKGEVDVENSRFDKAHTPAGTQNGRIESGVRR